jgi:RNA polymerase sigma factor (sigma-70 family)
VEEVVDAVLLRAYREFVKDPAAREIRRGWLMRLAVERLESEARRSRIDRERTVHIEEDIPETPPAEAVSTLGDEILDFYEPEEDWKLEDVIADMQIPTPEQATERKELRQCVNAALTTMPKEWRRALLLRHAEGVSEAELATIVGSADATRSSMSSNARAGTFVTSSWRLDA